MAEEKKLLIESQDEVANKIDSKALYSISYGLYVVTSNDGIKDNGLIVNTVAQVASSPSRIAVSINKDNYSHNVIKETGVMNVNCLTVDAPFSLFQKYGFQSGKTVDKFAGETVSRSDNGLVYLQSNCSSFISLSVEQYLDLGSHGMFICSITESRVFSRDQSMTYSYYQKNVKPKPKANDEKKKGYVCRICGWVYEGDELPEDIVCPICKHGAADFEPIQKNDDNKKDLPEMNQYVCQICGFVYDEAKGLPELGIAPGTKFEDLPEGFSCPQCTVGKELFEKK